MAERRRSSPTAGSAPEPAAGYVLKLAKEDFKFSAAHFTLFAGGRAELLHGHNYRVRLELEAAQLDPMGLIADIATLKARLRAVCARLDEHTLIPEKSELLEIRSEGDGLAVRLAERSYRLPREDAALLPLANVTIELLARMLWDEIAPVLAGSQVDALVVEVEETPGQCCAYRAPLPGRR